LSIDEIMRLGVLGEALMAAAALASISFFEVLPAPFNSVAVGGGVGMLAATSILERSRRRSNAWGDAGLPTVPKGGKGPRGASMRTIDDARLLKKFDKLFAKFKSHEDSSAKAAALEELKPVVFALSSEIRAWRGDTRLRMFMLMSEIASNFDDKALVSPMVALLVSILSKGGESSLEVAKPMFRERVSAMYANPDFKNERFLPRLMLILDCFEEAIVERMAREAIHQWDEERFKASGEFLGFEELGPMAERDKLKAMLGQEISRAGLDQDNRALDRAVELYHTVR